LLLTGRAPFQGATTHETIHKVLHEEATSPRRLNQAVPPDLEVICLKCLEKDQRRRYTSAKELADDLSHFLRGEVIQARPVGAAQRLWRVVRRHRVKASLAVALLSLILSGAALFVRYPSSLTPLTNRGELPAIASLPTNCAQGISGVINGRIYVTSATDGN